MWTWCNGIRRHYGRVRRGLRRSRLRRRRWVRVQPIYGLLWLRLLIEDHKRTYVHSRPVVSPGPRTNIRSVLLINVKIVAFPLHFCYNVITKDKKGEKNNALDYIYTLVHIRSYLCYTCRGLRTWVLRFSVLALIANYVLCAVYAHVVLK